MNNLKPKSAQALQSGEWTTASPRTLLPPLAAFLSVFLLVAAGSFTPVVEYLELAAYDSMIRMRANLTSPEIADADSPIAIVGLTEEEIDDAAFWDYPISDHNLTALLGKVVGCEPVVVGLDIFRSSPVPKSGEGRAAFEQLLANHPNIVIIKQFPHGTLREVPAPSVLENIEDENYRLLRIASPDFPVDRGLNRKVRRALLHQSSKSGESYSLSFVLTQLYLYQEGIEIGQDAEGNALFGGTSLRAVRRGAGGYSRGTFAENSSVFLNFTSAGNFSGYGFKEVMSPEFSADALKGKIVLVGVVAETIQDFATTPLLPDHRGINLHGVAAKQLIDIAQNKARPMRVFREWQEVSVIFLCCFVGAACGFFMLRPAFLIPAVLIGVLAIAVLSFSVFINYWWIPVAAPALGLALSAASVNIVRGAADRRDRKTIEILFGRSVGHDFANAIWKERHNILQSGGMPPREMPATIMMTDLKNFSVMAQQLSSRELFERLNDYLGMVSRIIGENGGVSKDFAGDAVHGAFGLPIRRETDLEINRDAANAVLSALRMREEMDAFNEKLRLGKKLSMRVGIATGSLIAGSLGSDHLLRLDFIGGVANLASRLESVRDERLPDDEGCRILVSETTWKCLGDQFSGEYMGEFELKGVGKTKIYQIL